MILVEICIIHEAHLSSFLMVQMHNMSILHFFKLWPTKQVLFQELQTLLMKENIDIQNVYLHHNVIYIMQLYLLLQS